MGPFLTIGTHNRGKLLEMSQLLGGLPVDILRLRDDILEIEETGKTFAENAGLKAAGYARRAEAYVLADDSGLAVAALDGRPGINSARYAGDNTPFSEKMAVVLSELDSADSNDRCAWFVCSLAFASPAGDILSTAEGVCVGSIATAPRGSGGFGYDPIFVPDGYDLTFGELNGAEKAKISHRARACTEIIPFLRDFFAELT
ncbi:MAG: RdgB/HAM1 family non-canonical purine NTP pyrophosphatase [Chloracidobacterium sp.]|nr:RdgB/HAM1 family non-canonical purine NTP pyrophosphatase [Chloracidobacterium sp.]